MRPGPTARAAAVLVVFLALFIAVDRLSGQRSARSESASGSSGPSASTTSRPATSATSNPPTSTAPPTTQSTTPSSQPTRATGTTLRSPRGVTVQVLNAVFVPGLAHRVADRIRRAGYDVVATNIAFGSYTISRIYYTDGHRADAEAFRARFPAFRTILPASEARAGLSPAVALHVIIGQNYKELG